LTGTFANGFNLYRLTSGRLEFGFLSTLTGAGDVWIPAGQDVSVLEITVCLKDQTPAGDYPLTLSVGELIDPSGQAVHCSLASGTLTVLADVVEGKGCSSDSCSGTEIPNPHPFPADLNAKFELGGATGIPGGSVSVPFIVRADSEVQGYSFSVDFDE